jgi:putative colanic acid biosysnthesis UDP-glucose lipid carrier transferase
MVMATMTAILFTLKLGADFSRGVTLLFFAFGLVFLVGFRIAVWRLIEWAFRTGFIIRKRVGLLIIGDDQWSDIFRREGTTRGVSINRIWSAAAVTADEPAAELSRTVIADLRDRKVDEVLICASAVKLDDVRRVAENLRLAPLRVRLLVDPGLVWPGSATSTRIGDNAIELSREPLSTFEQATKRCFDLVVASFALLMLAPLFALVALAIRLESRGPILFRQHRDGFNDAPFLIYKFRSMDVTENGPVVIQAKPNDERVTRIGRLIRRTSIDELPQLLNVLRGDMSIVGPRPHAVAHGQLYSSMIGDYAHRHHVKPGLTGWAQVNGSRGPTPTMESMKKRIDLDIWYIGNWSFWLDMRIILLTIRLIFTGKDAY